MPSSPLFSKDLPPDQPRRDGSTPPPFVEFADTPRYVATTASKLPAADPSDHPMSHHNRREFLSSSAAAASALALGAYANPAPAQQSKSPNERLRIAGIGTTGRAAEDLKELSSQDIVALADVDDTNMVNGTPS